MFIIKNVAKTFFNIQLIKKMPELIVPVYLYKKILKKTPELIVPAYLRKKIFKKNARTNSSGIFT
jgi:hypothetical protein